MAYGFLRSWIRINTEKMKSNFNKGPWPPMLLYYRLQILLINYLKNSRRLELRFRSQTFSIPTSITPLITKADIEPNIRKI